MIIGIIAVNHSNGQKIGGFDAEWIYNYNGAWSFGITKVSYQKDTLIRNRLSEKFTKIGYRKDTEETTFVVSLDPIYFYNDMGIVEYSIDGENFDTLFNFIASIGKSWIIPERNQNGDTLTHFNLTILDTFRTIISGKELLTQVIEYNHITGSFVDTIYESIGRKWDYILPFDKFAVSSDGGEGGVMRCFYNSELGVTELENRYSQGIDLYNSFEYNCNQLTSIIDMDNKNVDEFTIFPNPFVNKLYIEYSGRGEKKVSIINGQGQQVKSEKIEQGNNELNLCKLKCGLYFIILDNKIIEKIIKR